MKRERVSMLETLGLSPLGARAEQLKMVFMGDPNVPPSRFGVSSLKIVRPGVAFATWLGRTREDRRTPIYNFFNRTPTPVEEGWSVRVTQVRDFRNGRRTYDSHNGTDFIVPPGTRVTTPAPGKVLLISNDFHRGGLKIFIDHGDGVATSCNHLARALVRVGDDVRRGQVIALSGASGVENVFCFPWIAPHVHFNVWIDGQYVDPFALEGSPEVPLWRAGDHPAPHVRGGGADADAYEATVWDEALIQAGIDDCKDPGLREDWGRIQDPAHRAMTLLMQMAYFPTRFHSRPCLYSTRHERRPILDLPFLHEEFVGVTYPGFTA